MLDALSPVSRSIRQRGWCLPIRHRALGHPRRDPRRLAIRDHQFPVALVALPRRVSITKRPVAVRQVQVGDDALRIGRDDTLEQDPCLLEVARFGEQEGQVVGPAQPVGIKETFDDVTLQVTVGLATHDAQRAQLAPRPARSPLR